MRLWNSKRNFFEKARVVWWCLWSHVFKFCRFYSWFVMDEVSQKWSRFSHLVPSRAERPMTAS
jgi:hypothetical protein